MGALVDYADRTAGVAVSFDGVANDGEPGEGDDVGATGSAVGGTGPDVMDAAAAGSTLFGGAGDDVLVGGPGADGLMGDGALRSAGKGTGSDQLSGMGGDDTLEGDGGSDLLDGGDGDDELRPGGLHAVVADRDVVRGGAGVDAAGLTGLGTAPLVLRLGIGAPASALGRIEGVETIGLRARRARLAGAAGPERLDLDARSGSVLTGGGGDDVLSTGPSGPTRSRTIVGGPGRDDVRPGSAGDRLELRDGERDAATCSRGGLLTTPTLDAADRLEGCGAPMRMDPATATLRGRVLSVPITCPPETPERCRGTLGLDSGGNPSRRFRVRVTRVLDLPRGRVTAVRVRLGPRQADRLAVAQRRLLRRDLAVRFAVELRRELRGQATSVCSEWTFDLRVAEAAHR